MPGLLHSFSQLPVQVKLIVALLAIVGGEQLWSRFAKSERGLRFIISMRPKNAEAHLSLGMLLAKQPDYFEEAEKEIRARFKTKE